MFDEQGVRIREGGGFIAALDQSGGSTPKALAAYGVPESSYTTTDEMFGLVHDFRARIATSPAFDSRIAGAILFEDTMRRSIAGLPSARYLWESRNIVPFIKIDKGLADKADGVQLMKPLLGLDSLLAEAKGHPIFGTKERSVIHEANRVGVTAVVTQQFEVAEAVLRAGLVPIVEPEISIASETKAEAEDILLQELTGALSQVSAPVMLKLTLPEVDGLYSPLVDHPKVLKVVALSGGYSLSESVDRLGANPGVIASFSRALTDGLRVDMTDVEFNAKLDSVIERIAIASAT